jgi:hypothetical protein
MKATAADNPRRKSLDRRISLRTALKVPVLIETESGPFSARLCNLSEGGAMVQTRAPLELGDHVTVRGGTVRAEGTVAWEEDNLLGIEFDTPLEEDDVARQILRSNAVAHRRQALAAAAAPAR